MTPKEIIDLIKAKNIEILDLKFQDFPGTWQHFSIPVSQAVPEIFDEGLGFDGSSIRGWQAIHASDMMVVPDPVTAVIDPFTECPTLSLICNI
ncbi:MAG: glutamine synthetase beta-grasp domain-containing protein, partial [Gammaproteobacteria bacterium]